MAQEKNAPYDVVKLVQEDSCEGISSRQDQEEKLIIAAWYSMCVALQQQVLSEGSRTPGQAQSFLAQQRQSTQARRGLYPRLHPR